MRVRLAQDLWLYQDAAGVWHISMPWVTDLYGRSKPGLVAWPVTVLLEGDEIELARRDGGAPDGAEEQLSEVVSVNLFSSECGTNDVQLLPSGPAAPETAP